MPSDVVSTRAERFFERTTRFPWLVLIVAVIGLASIARFIPALTVDTRSIAFLPRNSPVVAQWDAVRETFGLADPMVVAVINDGPNGVFTPGTLALVEELTEEIRRIPGVDPERVTSLSTEKDVAGTPAGIAVEPFLDPLPRTVEEAQEVRRKVMDFPLYVGSLVGRNEDATLIVAELLDARQAAGAYADTLSIVESVSRPHAEKIHVAGQGAVTAYLSATSLRDTSSMLPITFLLINLALLFSYRTIRGLLLPNLLGAAAVISALGMMGLTGVPIYIIAPSMIVVLIAVCVADGLHVLGQYYEEVTRRPGATSKELVVATMAVMWRPVVVTSVTTVAGFVGIAFSSFMPPLRAWGVFASLGVVVALLLALFVLPAILVLLPPRESKIVSRALLKRPDEDGASVWDMTRLLGSLARWIHARAAGSVVAAALLASVGVFLGSRLTVDEERIENFYNDQPIYQAARAIDRFMDGANFLDVNVTTDAPGNVLLPENLKKIESLQAYLETLPHINGTTSVVDLLKQIARSLNEGDPAAYALPATADLAAQYLLLFSASGADSADRAEFLDPEDRLANVRARLDTARYSSIAEIIRRADGYLKSEFNGSGIEADLTGRVYVDYSWLSVLAPSHFRSVIISFSLLLLFSMLCFRSVTTGLVCMIPVSMAAIAIYATLGGSGVPLGVATSMSVAVALGTGIDFAVHMIDRVRLLVREQGLDLGSALVLTLQTTGRALTFCFAAVCLGFGALMVGSLATSTYFAGLIALGVAVSFVASITLLPAVIQVLGSRVIGPAASVESAGLEAAVVVPSTDTPAGARSLGRR